MTVPSIAGAARSRVDGARLLAGTMLAVAFIQATVVSPGDVAALLAYTPAHGRWWTVFTHPLVHAGAWTALANSFVIAAYGRVLERRWGRWEYLRFAMACALGSWAAQAALVGGTAILQGGAGVAMGTVLAYATERHEGPRAPAAAVGMTVLAMRSSLTHNREAQHEQPGFNLPRAEYGYISHRDSLGETL